MNSFSPKRKKDERGYAAILATIGAQSSSARSGRPRQEDLMKAFQFYSQTAQFGHVGASYELGTMFDRGVTGVVEENPAKAALYYEAAVDGGMAAAMFNLGFMYEKGRGVTRNLDRALSLWEDALALGHSKSMMVLGERYFHGVVEGGESVGGSAQQNLTKAIYYFGLAAEQNHPKAIATLANMYEHGLGVTQSRIRSEELRDLAQYYWVKQQEPAPGRTGAGKPAALPKWLVYLDGKKLPQWKEQMVLSTRNKPPVLLELLTNSPAFDLDASSSSTTSTQRANGGDIVPATSGKARRNMSVRATPTPSDSRFVAQLEAMCAQDRATEGAEMAKERAAQQALEGKRSRQSSRHDSGNAVDDVDEGDMSAPADEDERWHPPLECLDRAKRGDCHAQYDVAFAYQHGQGVNQDYAEALRWYRRAAEQGDPSAQLKLGLMYEHGQGVVQDYQVAATWIRRSADLGVAAAQYNMGYLLEHGLGFDKNIGDAIEYYRKAAQQNYAPAQFNLGCLFHDDHTTEHDQEAVSWFLKAARHGHVLAMLNLGTALHSGQGISQDFYLAAQWLKQAASAGNAVAQRRLGYLSEHGQGCVSDDTMALKWYTVAAEQGDEASLQRIPVLEDRIRDAAEAKLREEQEQDRDETGGDEEIMKEDVVIQVPAKKTVVRLGLMTTNSKGGRQSVASEVVAPPRAAGLFSPVKSVEQLFPKINA